MVSLSVLIYITTILCCTFNLAIGGMEVYQQLISMLFQAQRYIMAINNEIIKVDPATLPIQLIEGQGYPVEMHKVVTDDGYLLTLHRIPYGRNKNVKYKGPVLIHHGLLGSADSWVLRSAKEDLAFILADAGYDVWLANCRGTVHSRKHIILAPEDEKFWEFGFHEIGYFDFPAIVDYVLGKTKEKDLYYIGHSMGTSITYILASTRPEYNSKFRLNIHLAPAVYFNERTYFDDMLIHGVDYMTNLVKPQGGHEIFPLSRTNAILGKIFCDDGSPTQFTCAAGLSFVLGLDYAHLNKSFIPHLLNHFPAGTSIGCFQTLQQSLKTGFLYQLDLGPEKNFKNYGHAEPLKYNYTKVTAPTILYYGARDSIISPVNSNKLGRHLENLVGIVRVARDTFNHMDFLWADDAKELVYDSILKVMQDF